MKWGHVGSTAASLSLCVQCSFMNVCISHKSVGPDITFKLVHSERIQIRSTFRAHISVLALSTDIRETELHT